eukprot:TRINITY_DN3904_c2_g1_i8.p1 TRINITY_DN3904_c2_g1~~TRINITY_DN3904_c2_g1_i8.p1  ORF type:complete len:761 (-),score=117.58 TRINITY_DN3904_c2_g1_i8:88-2370(-)
MPEELMYHHRKNPTINWKEMYKTRVETLKQEIVCGLPFVEYFQNPSLFAKELGKKIGLAWTQEFYQSASASEFESLLYILSLLLQTLKDDFENFHCRVFFHNLFLCLTQLYEKKFPKSFGFPSLISSMITHPLFELAIPRPTRENIECFMECKMIERAVQRIKNHTSSDQRQAGIQILANFSFHQKLPESAFLEVWQLYNNGVTQGTFSEDFLADLTGVVCFMACSDELRVLAVSMNAIKIYSRLLNHHNRDIATHALMGLCNLASAGDVVRREFAFADCYPSLLKFLESSDFIQKCLILNFFATLSVWLPIPSSVEAEMRNLIELPEIPPRHFRDFESEGYLEPDDFRYLRCQDIPDLCKLWGIFLSVRGPREITRDWTEMIDITTKVHESLKTKFTTPELQKLFSDLVALNDSKKWVNPNERRPLYGFSFDEDLEDDDEDDLEEEEEEEDRLLRELENFRPSNLGLVHPPQQDFPSIPDVPEIPSFGDFESSLSSSAEFPELSLDGIGSQHSHQFSQHHYHSHPQYPNYSSQPMPHSSQQGFQQQYSPHQHQQQTLSHHNSQHLLYQPGSNLAPYQHETSHLHTQFSNQHQTQHFSSQPAPYSSNPSSQQYAQPQHPPQSTRNQQNQSYHSQPLQQVTSKPVQTNDLDALKMRLAQHMSVPPNVNQQELSDDDLDLPSVPHTPTGIQFPSTHVADDDNFDLPDVTPGHSSFTSAIRVVPSKDKVGNINPVKVDTHHAHEVPELDELSLRLQMLKGKKL